MKLKYLDGRIPRLTRRYPPYPLVAPADLNTLEFSPHHKIWIPHRDPQHLAYRFVECYSIRQFRRFLKRWSIYLPPGTEFVLYRGGNEVIGKTT